MVKTRFIPLLALVCIPTAVVACQLDVDKNDEEQADGDDGDGDGGAGFTTMTTAETMSTSNGSTTGGDSDTATTGAGDDGGTSGDSATTTAEGDGGPGDGGPGSGAEDSGGGDGGSPLCGENTDACNDPFDDCICMGCTDDGMCTEEEDCICDDCDYDLFCGDAANCNGDGFCDIVAEGCVCADCTPIPACEDFAVNNSCAGWCGGGPVPGSNPQCSCDAACVGENNCCEDMCEFDICGENPVCTGQTQCVEDSGECNDPPNDCSCVGCVDDEMCGAGVDEDCTCADCMGAGACGCNGDYYCDVFIESCSCSDCMDLALCAGQGGGQAIIVEEGPGLVAAVADDAYDGSLTSMTCSMLTVDDEAVTTVSNVALVVGMSHDWIGDLVMKVVSPSASIVTVLNRPGLSELGDDGLAMGGDSSNLGADSRITFMPTGNANAEAMGSSIAGELTVCAHDGMCAFAPNAGAAAGGDLSSFAGETGIGNWSVCVGDAGAGNVGTIDFIELALAPA